jgi:hypothetical protein
MQGRSAEEAKHSFGGVRAYRRRARYLVRRIGAVLLIPRGIHQVFVVGLFPAVSVAGGSLGDPSGFAQRGKNPICTATVLELLRGTDFASSGVSFFRLGIARIVLLRKEFATPSNATSQLRLRRLEFRPNIRKATRQLPRRSELVALTRAHTWTTGDYQPILRIRSRMSSL